MRLAQAGLIVDYLPPEVARPVADGTTALDAAYQEALKKQQEWKRRKDLPPALGVLVDAGTITITEALGRAELPEEYRARIASGELTLDEAAALWRQATRVHDDAVARMVGDIRSFLSAWDTAVKVQDHDWRDEVLGELHKHERDRFLEIEKGALLDAVVWMIHKGPLRQHISARCARCPKIN